MRVCLPHGTELTTQLARMTERPPLSLLLPLDCLQIHDAQVPTSQP